MFDLITTVVPYFKPKIVHADFEFAITNALKTLFPKIIVVRCYYHFTNSLWKKAKTLCIKCKTLRRIVGLCCNLPLLPNNMIFEGWNYITNECNDINNKKIEIFLSYFKKFYLKKKIHRRMTVAKLLSKILAPNKKITNRRDEMYQIRDNLIINAQMQLLTNEISVGHFLDKLR
ncbi:Uncharacterized protein OBRU01_24439 [Operophtera brumata]|uniref:MULE transposase domain-containing protein n=1 Tax=Operophtera brumata TaxID=104452 RepID=A0A0L7KBP2_OPEBR|nr:Uncharacterized protein OBRU01_24439 [Operophtera brumata]